MKQPDLKSFTILMSLGPLFLLLLTFTQCNSKAKAYISEIGGNDVIICPFEKITDTICLPLSSLVESCEMVRLQTSDDAFIDYARCIGITDKYICIKSYGRYPVKLFNRNGQFIRNIGVIGRGPGEYGSLGGLQFNREGNKVYLIPEFNARNILVYGVEGNILKEIPLVYPQRKFKALVYSDSIVTVFSMPIADDPAVCFQQTLDGKLIQKVTPPSYLISQDYNGEVYISGLSYYNTISDTLYYYNTLKNRLEPKFTLSFKDGRRGHGIYSELPGFYCCFNILVYKNTLDSRYFYIKNDFWGGINTSPNVFGNEYFINEVTAIYLKQQLEIAIKNKKLDDQMRQKLIDLNNTLSPDDNNIIFFGKWKQT
jgi:hypothetical protein